MIQNDFVPLSYYLNSNIFDFFEIPDNTLNKIGFLETKIESEEAVKDLGSHTETFYDETEKKDITISYTDVEVKRKTKITVTLANSQELSFKIAGIDGIELVLASTESSSTSPYTATLILSDDGLHEFLSGITFKLRFSHNLLKPMIKKIETTGKTIFEEDKSAGSLEVEMGKIEIKIDTTGHFSFNAKAGFSIKKPAMIGETGVIIDELTGIAFNFDGTGSKPQKAPNDWKGLHIGSAKVYLPDIVNGAIGAENLGIGSGGFYGEINYNGTKIDGDLFGLKGSISFISLELVQTIPTQAVIKGEMQIPFFDGEVSVEIGIDLEGNFTVGLDSDKELYIIKKGGVFRFKIDSITFEVVNNKFTAKLSGELKPLLGSIDWPSFKVDELSIDSDGNVHLDGGWLDLPKQYSIDFHGFPFEITKLGFGKTEDGRKWIGFSGGLKLVDGLPIGASVEGLRIIWDDSSTNITFNGIGVEYKVPDVLHFKGAVAYENEGEKHRFVGDIKLNLIALDMQLDCKLVIGLQQGTAYMGIYLKAELPAGIPLWSTGAALYGMAGLYTQQMEPNRKEGDAWYGIDKSKSWYHHNPIGVTSITEKWDVKSGSFALGAGVTIGTVSDNGYAFSGKMMLVIVFPGPILMIEGKANLLKKRTSLDEEPLFRALAVLDARAGTFLIGLDAQYKYGGGGELIEIGGSAEMFFSLNDASAWHLYLGQREPREKRIQAKIFKLFGANSYVMMDANGLAFGSWVGYGNKWKFGPLRVTLEAWMEYNVGVNWMPPHLHGDIWVHGKAELEVFWFDLGLSVDARIEADVFDPFHLLGDFRVGIALPWPIPDISVGITIEWGPRLDRPPLPKPLKEIAIEHLKVTESWPLPAGKLLLPVYDENNDGFLDQKSLGSPNLPDNLPVVPLDSKPHITFTRPVHDDAHIGLNPQPPQPKFECIGDPEKGRGPLMIRYGLKEISLEYLSESTWVPVARNKVKWNSKEWVEVANPNNIPKIFGSWAPVPAMPDSGGEAVAQTKLWLFSKNPFDYTRHTGGYWDEWFIERFSGYPCIRIPEDQEVCYTFEHVKPLEALASPWSHHDDKQLIFVWRWPQPLILTEIVINEKNSYELCFPNQLTGRADEGRQEIIIKLPQPSKEVTLVTKSTEGISDSDITGYDISNIKVGEVIVERKDVVSGSTGTRVYISGRKGKQMITHIVITNNEVDFCLLAVCVMTGLSYDEIDVRVEMEDHLRSEMARWNQTGAVLEPYTTYRLKVITTMKVEGQSGLGHYLEDLEQEEFAYFRTEGPPGLTKLSIPEGISDREEEVQRDSSGKFVISGNNGNTRAITKLDSTQLKPGERFVLKSDLNSLMGYVRQTVPATVPVQGDRPALPRPVYRAYDVGVEFNENYVDLMYRMVRQDLGLYLYDNNNQPVRDAEGRLIVLNNRWGRTELLKPSNSDMRWITTLNSSKCVPKLDLKTIPLPNTLTSTIEGLVLSADTVYEARLTPLLLHEDFSSFSAGVFVEGSHGKIDGWKVVDHGNMNGPSHWETGKLGTPESFYISQTSDIWGGSQDGTDAIKPGTYLLRDDDSDSSSRSEQPSTWKDYRLTAYLRSSNNDAIGLVFRYISPQQHYFFAMDRERKYRRLVRVSNGQHKILAQDSFVYIQNQDYFITVEAIGSSLRLYQDGELIFYVIDDSILHGTVGLYCWGNHGARFSDVRVDNLQKSALVVHRFEFTTSQYANFFHHIHSFQDEIWTKKLQAGINIGKDLKNAEPPVTAKPLEQEVHTYQKLITSIFGSTARKIPKEVQVTRIEQNNNMLAFLFESPEPIDWERTALQILQSGRLSPKPSLPGVVKLTSVNVGTNLPNQESVSLLLRDTADLTNHSIEHQRFPGPLTEPLGNQTLLFDDFKDSVGGLLFREDFGPNALDFYSIVVDEGAVGDPPIWIIGALSDEDGNHYPTIMQNSNISGVVDIGEGVETLGTMAITGSAVWSNLRVRATLLSDYQGSIGIIFRYQDVNNYYRFSMGRLEFSNSFRLSKKVDGYFTTLWEIDDPFEYDRSYLLTIDAYGERFIGYLDNRFLFSIKDNEITAGKVGFCCSQNDGAFFEALEIDHLEKAPFLWQPFFEDLDVWEIFDDPRAEEGPSEWRVEDNTLIQLSQIYVPDDVLPSILDRAGSYITSGDESWEDVQVSVNIRSESEGVAGVMFRVSPQFDSAGELEGYDHYHLSFYYEYDVWLLLKVVDGASSFLTYGHLELDMDRTCELTISAIGSELQGYLDGSEIFKYYDGELKNGLVGLHSCGAPNTYFSKLVVMDRTRYMGQWSIKDEGIEGTPSDWRIENNALLQMSAISGGSYPESPGTYALAGDDTWTDYCLTVKLRSDDVGTVGIMFRYTDIANYYRLSIDQQVSRCQLIKIEKGTVRQLDEKQKGYIAGESFILTVNAVGPRLVCYINNELLFDITDKSHAEGKIGLYCWGNQATRFEEIWVKKPSLEAYALFSDHFTTGSLNGWNFINNGTELGPSNWQISENTLRQSTDIFSHPIDIDTLDKLGTQAVASGDEWSDAIFSSRLESHDNDAIGLLFRYKDKDNYYRFSMDCERKYRRLVKNVGGNFTLIWEDDFSYTVGQSYELTIIAIGSTLRGYFDGISMFVVEDFDISSGHIGLYCWGNSDARFSQVRVYPPEIAFDNWLLDEPFDVLVHDRWTFVDQGNQQGPSQWDVTNGELRQTSNIYGGRVDKSFLDKPGAVALAGDKAWTDYRFSVHFCSDNNDGIGVVFRYQDENNYYRFAMNQELHYRALTKIVNGKEVKIKSNIDSYILQREYILTIDCIGEQLTVYLDGIKVFSVEDKDLDTGCIGLYSMANTGARFKEVRVTEPKWMSYYTFGREDIKPAGTQVRVNAGKWKEDLATEPNIVYRFKAPAGEDGELSFSTDGENIRLRAPDTTEVHKKYFLANSEYTSVNDVKVLRNADGTGVFVVVPTIVNKSSQNFTKQYRLVMEYHRDNLALYPKGQVLSQASDSDHEKVTIDIPV